MCGNTRWGGGGGAGEMNLFDIIFDPIKSLHESLHKPRSTYQKSLITDAFGQGDTLYSGLLILCNVAISHN